MNARTSRGRARFTRPSVTWGVYDRPSGSRPAAPPVSVWAAVAGLAVLSTALAYVLYFRILASAGATNLLLVTLLIPVTAVLLGVGVLPEGYGFDVVFDTVAGDNVGRSVEAARLNGQVATVGAPAGGGLRKAYGNGISVHFVAMLIPMVQGVGRSRHGDILRRVATLVDDGHLRPLVDDSTFTFDEISDAHAYAEAGKQIGKVVVRHPER